jgi:hypothetical protein
MGRQRGRAPQVTRAPRIGRRAPHPADSARHSPGTCPAPQIKYGQSYAIEFAVKDSDDTYSATFSLDCLGGRATMCGPLAAAMAAHAPMQLAACFAGGAPPPLP